MSDLRLLRMLIRQPLTTHVFGILLSALIMALFGMLLWQGAAAMPPPEVLTPEMPPAERALPMPEKEGRAPAADPGLV